MVSILGLAHFLNALIEIGAGAMFLIKPELAFPLAKGNAAFIEVIAVLGYAVIALGTASLFSLFFGTISKRTLGLALLAYHVPLTALFGLKVQKDSKALEQFGPVLVAHGLLALLFIFGTLFSRDGSKKKTA